MTVDDARRDERTDYLAALLPAHVMERDAETGGLVRALLGAVAGELARVEDDLDALYDAWFVETAPEWVVPYLADLVGLDSLPGDLGTGSGAGVSRRAVVANTVAYRQRKGTVAVLEQVVRDVTGWPARAVEFYRLLATTAHVNHVRPDRPALASLRHAGGVELEADGLAHGALTTRAHTAEVRRVDPGPTGGRGRYGIPHIGVFVFPSQVYEVTGTRAHPVGTDLLTHPLDRPCPWFFPPATEDTIEHLAGEPDLPVPLRPRRLLALLRGARQGTATPGTLPVTVRVDDGDALPPVRLRVCGLEGLARRGDDTADTGDDDPTQALDGWQVVVDPVAGRIQPYLDGDPYDPAVHGVHVFDVDHAAGAVADVGAGTYDRSAAHDDALDGDPFVAVEDRRDRVDAQAGVPGGPAAPDVVTIADAVAAVADGWAADAASHPGGTRVVSVADPTDHVGDVDLAVPADSRLVVVAAAWEARTLLSGDVAAPVPGVYAPTGLRPRVVGDVLVTGAEGSALLLDGLVVLGDVRVRPGNLTSLTVSQCTVAGRVLVEGTAGDANRALQVTVVRSMVGGVELVGTVPGLRLADSVVDPGLAVLAGGSAGPAVRADGAHTRIDGSTLRGEVGCRLLDVTSSICDGVVTVEDRQRGCARFSYLGPGSRTPRRFRCVPSADADGAPGPAYASLDPASPSYPALSATAPVAIRRGGEGGAEMGVHHHLRRPLRTDAARRLVEPYVPAGMQIGIFGS
ncbi:phage tail protein [Isoptericola sp. 178]|uniref:phage tail protein n=1 Tax=Isoptericola sp. 178 TaxID=3064651 RepID=UPI0027131667|nr:phage tail protein [Isoptericola sp. 178]MDO8144906.1 phage tail protein [Isoptericola sp. 178]